MQKKDLLRNSCTKKCKYEHVMNAIPLPLGLRITQDRLICD